jgi:hypothetical protein
MTSRPLKDPNRPVKASTLLTVVGAIGDQIVEVNEAARDMVVSAFREQFTVTAEYDAGPGELVIRTAFESKTLGETFRREARCRLPGYRGTWQRAGQYLRGDSASWKGSLWHCCATATTERPGDSRDWQLMHKPHG